MRVVFALCALVVVTFVHADLPLAEPCDETACSLPNCKCSSASIPGGLNARDTPQFVVLTFDNAINVQNIISYRSLLYGRNNRNACPIGATFFVSHEYCDYTLINELYNEGFEIGLNSISRRADQEYWRSATTEILMSEIGDQAEQIAHFASIPRDAINGIRSPFLQMAGNATFEMMATAGLKYDLSWPTIRYTNPGLWPYTLDYESTQDCVTFPCPTASIPGPWVMPIVTWSDLEGIPCTIIDACFYIPDRNDENGWFDFIIRNFERHYLNNRSPFVIYVSEWYIIGNPGLHGAFTRFLDTLSNLNDVFMVNANEVVEWVKHPVPINEYIRQSCRTTTPSQCRATSCSSVPAEHNGGSYYMNICNRCPRVYPWVDNYLGL